MNRAIGVSCSWKEFSRYVLPSVAAMLLFSLYTVVDGIFVAWGAGETALTSVNIALPFVSSLSGFSVLISMGTATLVAFARGRGDEKEASALFSQTVAVILIVSAVITSLVAFFSKPLALLLGAGSLTVTGTSDYLRIVSLFSVCFILSYCLEIMVKVDDNPQMAIVGVGASFITNIVLDYLFVIVLQWGVKGAAWATGIAQVISLAIFLFYFFSQKSHLKLSTFSPRPRVFLRIFPLGVADCSVELIVAFLTFLYNHILMALFGESSLTVYAVIAYLNLFVFMMMQGVAQGMMHLVSLQIGGGNEGKADGYFRMCLITTFALGILFTGFSLGMPELMVKILLKEDSAVFQEAVRALRLYSLSFLFVGFNIAIAGYFTARGKAVPSIALALGRGFVFAPVALLIFSFFWNGTWIWMSACVGELLCVLVSIYVLRRYKNSRVKM